ncbi:hypothetical protein F4861DRAFT_343967 [Xylaria intraflava]|nr:hypothetical protein F4861DRAFT_343967 [Xylaria intraflava]
MKFTNVSICVGFSKSVLLAFAAILGNSHPISAGIASAGDATILPRALEKRDAYTCYGDGASVSDCQGAIKQLLPLGDQKLELYSGVCLNWSHDTCNIRFCAQPYVLDTINRTASWIHGWTNSSLMDCVRGGQYSVMGDSINLNGNGGTYRLHLERNTVKHT